MNCPVVGFWSTVNGDAGVPYPVALTGGKLPCRALIPYCPSGYNQPDLVQGLVCAEKSLLIGSSEVTGVELSR